MRFKWRSFCLTSRNDTKRTNQLSYQMKWERNVLQKLWEGDSFFDASYTRRSTPCSGYLFKEEMHNRSMLTGQTFQCEMGGLHGVNRHSYGLSWSRENIFDQKQQNEVTKLPTTSWTPNFFFWEIFNRVIKPQTFESNVWWVLTLHTNVETS